MYWKIFTEKLQNSIKKHIPTKTISGRWDVPWMTQHIKCKIHQKHRMYNNASRTSKESYWRKFRNMRKHIKDLLKKSHTEYVMGLLDIKLLYEDGQRGLFSLGKRFWTYVRSQRRDQVGITRLKEGDKEITNSKEFWDSNMILSSQTRIWPSYLSQTLYHFQTLTTSTFPPLVLRNSWCHSMSWKLLVPTYCPPETSKKLPMK